MVITQITIDEVIQDQTTDKTPNGLLEIEVRVGIVMIIMILEAGVEIEIIGEERNLGPESNSRVSTNHDCMRCYRC